MKKYKIAIMEHPMYGTVKLFTTDEDLFKWFLAEIKKRFPSCNIMKYPYKSGNEFYCTVDQLSRKDQEVNYWLLNHLCNNGWEPFAIDQGGRYHLRYVIES